MQIEDLGSEQHWSPGKTEEIDRQFVKQPSTQPETDRQPTEHLSLQIVPSRLLPVERSRLQESRGQ
jgi:hypothetical protein